MSFPQPSSSQPQNLPQSGSPLKSVLKSALVTVLLLGGILYAMNTTGVISLSDLLSQGDHVSQTEMQERSDAFNALTPLPLTVVKQEEISKALDSMQLSPAARKDLEAQLSVASSAPASQPTPAAAPAPSQKNIKLVWITLWDTDVEDGDAVRIDSQGYSRTIVLKKKPALFAIPVPSNGVINVTGISDGDGGGITVGLASGASKAVFPIMSVGQVLGLKVKVD